MDQMTQLLARWFSVVAGGLFSYGMIDLVVSDRLKYYLADKKFELLVVFGGVALAVIVMLKLRALMLVAPAPDHHHDHDGGHAHVHGHAHHAHDHSHGLDHVHRHDHGHAHAHDHSHGDHDHSVSLWRLIVVFVPLMIIMTGLAPRGLSADVFEKTMTQAQRDAIAAVGTATLPEGRVAGGTVESTTAMQLQADALIANQRERWERVANPIQAQVEGQYVPDGRFTDRYRLMRIKVTCCAADATPLEVTVMGSLMQTDFRPKYGDWLQVTGPVSYFKSEDKRTGEVKFHPVIHQQEVRPTTPKPYLQ